MHRDGNVEGIPLIINKEGMNAKSMLTDVADVILGISLGEVSFG